MENATTVLEEKEKNSSQADTQNTERNSTGSRLEMPKNNEKDCSEEAKVTSLPSGYLTPDSTPVKNSQGTQEEAKASENSTPPKCVKTSTGKEREVTPIGQMLTGKGRKGKKVRKSRKKDKAAGAASKSEKKQESPVTKRLTDFFPVRRSNRKCKSKVEAEEKKQLEDAILSGKEEGLKVQEIIGKGRGVIATKFFKRGQFVVEYYGDLIDIDSAKDLEDKYSKDSTVGCYMYYFEFKNQRYCVDATKESGRLGRLLNHSKSGNCCTKLVSIQDKPHLILVAKRDIKIGEELLYDYGDRNKDSLQAHPWLAL